jgi:hypothetical protein
MEEMGTRQEILTEVNKVDLDDPIVKNDVEEERNPELKELRPFAEELRKIARQTPWVKEDEAQTDRAMQEERARQTEFQAEHRCGGEDAQDRAIATGYCEDARWYREAVDAGVRR